MKRHKVAIVVPTWNNLEGLKRFVDMARERTSSKCKVLILDDGSTDGTKEYLDTLEGDKKFEALLFAQNAGPNEMWNFGVNYLKEDGYDWIIISNDDVEYPVF